MAAKRNKWLVFPLLLAAVVLASALLFWMGFRHDNKYIRPRHEAKLGITWLDMERYEADPLLFLVEGWEFYGGKLLTPEEIPHHPPDATLFIGQYGGFDLGDPDAPRHGVATYRMTVAADGTRREYALETPEIFTNWRLWINGELMQSVGMGDALSSLPQHWMVTFPASGNIEIVVQVEDRNGLYSGMVYPPAFGSPQAVGQYLTLRLLIHVAACGMALLIALLCLAVGAGTKFRLPYEGLAALCLCFCIFAAWPVFQALGLRDGWPVLERCGYYGMFLCILWMQGRFARLPKWVHRAACSVGILVCTSILLQPLFPMDKAGNYFLYGRLLEGYKWLVAAYLLGGGIYAVWKKRGFPKSLLYGYGVFATALVCDRLLPLYEPILSGWPAGLAGFLLVLVITGVLWKDTVQTYRESASLRQQKVLADTQLNAQREYALLQQDYLERTERLLHETRNHFTLLRHYTEIGNKKKSLTYIDALLQSGEITVESYTGHELLNALLTVQMRRAKELDVYTELEVADIPAALPVADGDLTAVVMNLLDNALDACESLPDERWLYLRMEWQSGELFIQCRNAFYTEAEQAKHTQRGIGHGYGSAIIRETVGLFGGTVETERGPDSYEVRVTLPARSQLALVK